MQINEEKLADIEQAAEREHLALLALSDKRAAARAELSRQKTAMWIGAAPRMESLRDFIERIDYDAEQFRAGMRNARADDEPLLASIAQSLEVIGKYKAAAQSATRRYELQESAWQAASAALPALREFAERVIGRPHGAHAGVRPDAIDMAGRGAAFFHGAR